MVLLGHWADRALARRVRIGHPDSFLNTDDAAESTLMLPGDRANVTLHRFFRFVHVLARVTRLPAKVAPGSVTAPDAESLSGRFAVSALPHTAAASARVAATR